MICRRDRDDGTAINGGGIAVYAKIGLHVRVTTLEISKTAERAWLLLHTDRGPYVLCCWYRRPDQGEIASINSFQLELRKHRAMGLGVIAIGDMNVHFRRWLRFSSDVTSVEGRRLWEVCTEEGLTQLVHQPTRRLGPARVRTKRYSMERSSCAFRCRRRSVNLNKLPPR